MTLVYWYRHQTRCVAVLPGALLVGFTLTTMIGCGGSESSESTIVPPPSPEVVNDSASDSEPPGELEMPEVELTDSPEQGSPAGSGGLEMPEDAKIPDSSGAGVQPNLQFGTWEEIQAFARTNGRITVVDLWSLSCEPCLKEFPGLVQLHQDFGSSVQCIAVNLDYDGRKTRPPEHYQARVADFLRNVGAAGFPTYISQTPSDDVYSAADLTSIPAVMIFDASGESVQVFVDAGETAGFSYDSDIIPLVSKLAG